MKPYGHKRREAANRKFPGTSRPCPCCNDRAHKAGREKKKRERQAARQETQQQPPHVDVRITGLGGSVVQFHLLTDTAREWVSNTVDAEPYMFMGQDILCCEARFADDLREAMLEHGLEVA